MRPASWSSARWGEKRRNQSRAPGGVVLVTFAETKVTQGAGAEQPAIMLLSVGEADTMKSRPRGGFVIQTLDPGFRRGDDSLMISRPINLIVIDLHMKHLHPRHTLVTKDEGELVNQGLPVEGIDAAAQHVVYFKRQLCMHLVQLRQLVELDQGEPGEHRRQQFDDQISARQGEPEDNEADTGEDKEKTVADRFCVIVTILIHRIAYPAFRVA